MDHLGRTILITTATLAAGIAGGIFLIEWLGRRTEDKLGGKLMKVHYRFSKEFED